MKSKDTIITENVLQNHWKRVKVLSEVGEETVSELESMREMHTLCSRFVNRYNYVKREYGEPTTN